MMRNRLPTGFWRNPVHLVAVGFGSGAAPYAPGTFGTLVALPIYWAMSILEPVAYVAVLALLCIAGVWVCAVTARDFGVHDHSGIVWDEVVGYLVTMTAAPRGWMWVAAGFLLFRVFDIAKPWPIRWIDRRIRGGIGIMLDDVLAGVYAMVVLQLAAATLVHTA